MLKMNKRQRRRVHALARDHCANCVDGSCLLLDDGEEHTCVQLLCRYGIACNYFLRAVLPGDRKLYEDIKRTNKIQTAGKTAERR